MVSAKFKMLFQLFSMKKYAILANSIYHGKIRWTKEHLFRWKKGEIAYNRQGIYFSGVFKKKGRAISEAFVTL